MKLIKKVKNNLKKINDLFTKREKIHFVLVLLLSIVMALFQALGIASVLPFMSIVMEPNIILENENYFYFYNLFNFTSVEQFIVYFGVLVLSIIIIGNIISALAVWAKTSFIWKKNHRLSVSLLDKYLTLPYSYFLSQNTADLGKNILFEVQILTGKFLYPFIRIITSSIMVIVVFTLLLFVNYTMTLIAALVLVSLYLLLYFKLSVKLKRKGKERMQANKRRFESASEALGGIKDLKVLVRERHFLNEYNKHSNNFSELVRWNEIVGQLPRYIMEIFAFGGVVALTLFLLSSDYSRNQIIPLVGLFAFAGYRLMPALQDIFNSFATFSFNKSALDKIHADMCENGLSQININLKPEKISPLNFQEKITLKDINFNYPNNPEKTLKNINLEIYKKQAIGIVGSTGSGKTTLVDIILGLLTPQEGNIIIDNTTINKDNLKNWQVNIGYVPQQIFLSDSSIKNNIAFGIETKLIDEEKVKKAAKLANLDQFIEQELKDKYETIVGERGIRLSGGQKQRIGIARALYHDPQVLIFDEATSSLDNVTEEAVLKAINSLSHFKTMIIIAHRLTTIKNCDNIYLIKQGQIADQGKYQELIDKNEDFKNIAKTIS